MFKSPVHPEPCACHVVEAWKYNWKMNTRLTHLCGDTQTSKNCNNSKQIFKTGVWLRTPRLNGLGHGDRSQVINRLFETAAGDSHPGACSPRFCGSHPSGLGSSRHRYPACGQTPAHYFPPSCPASRPAAEPGSAGQ